MKKLFLDGKNVVDSWSVQLYILIFLYLYSFYITGCSNNTWIKRIQLILSNIKHLDTWVRKICLKNISK